MPVPDGARRTLAQRLELRRQERWPALEDLTVRYRGSFAYIAGSTEDGPMPLFRLRYIGSPKEWGFAIYLASKDGYEDSFLPRGSFTGTPEEALDCACGLYLDDVTAWTDALDEDRPHSRENF
ncbi:MAG: hypothetical protein ACRDYB_03580 [Acidimicrobiales bacterium]